MNAIPASKQDLRQAQAKRMSERDQLAALFLSLKLDRQALIGRMAEHKAKLASLEQEIALIPGQLVDTDEPKAKGKLMDSLAKLERDHKQLSLELAELERREALTFSDMLKAKEAAGPGPGFELD